MVQAKEKTMTQVGQLSHLMIYHKSQMTHHLSLIHAMITILEEQPMLMQIVPVNPQPETTGAEKAHRRILMMVNRNVVIVKQRITHVTHKKLNAAGVFSASAALTYF